MKNFGILPAFGMAVFLEVSIGATGGLVLAALGGLLAFWAFVLGVWVSGEEEI